MSVASRITSMTEHIQNAYDSIERFGVDTESIDKNLVNLSNTITNEIYDKLPKVSGNGSNFTLENVQNGKLDLFEMEGNTYQNSYTGKNLNVYPYDGFLVSNGIIFNINNDGTILINGQNNNNGNSAIYFYRYAENSIVVPAGTYYILPPSNTTINYVMYDGTSYYNFNKSNNYSITFNEQKIMRNFYVQVSKGNTTIFTNEKVYPMLSTTPVTIDDYEPYVGGVPSPNPNYPQEIEVVENKQTVNVSGKNLCSGTKLLSARNIRFYIDKKIKKTLTISFTTNESLNNNSLYLSVTNALATTITADANAKATATLTLSDEQYSAIQNATNPYFLLYKSGANFTVPNDAQIENGSIATPFEKYHNQDYEIDLGDIELCKIGDYKDVIFKNNQLSEHYDSTLDEDSWYIKKNIGKVVLDGTQSIKRTTTGTSDYYRFDVDIGKNIITTDDVTEKAQIYSDKLTGVSRANTYAKIQGIAPTTSSYSYKTFDLYIEAISQMTIEEANIWLSNNPVTVYYILNTPTYEKITNSTLISQLEAIETETGTNIFEVSNDNDVLPSLNVKRLKELEKLS